MSSAVIDLTASQPSFASIPLDNRYKRDDDDDDEDEVVFVGTSAQVERTTRTSTTNDEVIARALADLCDGGPPQCKKRRISPYSCSICLEEDVDSRKGYSLEACGHTFCVECLTGLVKAADHARLEIPCPDCQKPLTTSDVRSILRYEPKAWSDYAQGTSLAFLEREVAKGSSRRCPAERCNYTFDYEKRTGGYSLPDGCLFICPECDGTYCLDCGANKGQVGPAHDGPCHVRRLELETAEEERRKLEEWRIENSQADQRFRELIQSERGKTKPCPKCGSLVTKNGGCDHMNCRCGHHYNWSSVR